MIDLIAFLDCETSGLWKDGAPDESQPHLLQLSCKVVDSNRRRVGRFTRIIRPEGFSIEPEAESIHGISEAYANHVGIPAWMALSELMASVELCTRIVGHNIMGFDRKIIELSIKRAGGTGEWWQKTSGKMFDTMEAATPILKLPGKFGDYKWPNLEETVNFFNINDSFDTWKRGAAYDRTFAPDRALDPIPSWRSKHDAEEDVNALEFIYWQLVDRGAA